jgi:ketosteroid isomerase-like protein
LSAPTHLDTIRTYYRGCSTGDAGLMKSVLAPDVVHYFTGVDPVRGAEGLAAYWVEDNTGDRRTVWTVDRAMVEGDEAVIEWSMFITFLDGRPGQRLRGAEWYAFRDGRIAEVRAYYRWIPGEPISELGGFPYAERGYPNGPKEQTHDEA